MEPVGWQQILPIVRDVVVTVAAAATAAATVVAAVKGLRTWRKQLKGKTEHELAYRMLTSALKVRNAIEMVRNPLMYESELGDQSSEQQQDNRSHAEKLIHAYQNRWAVISDAIDQLAVASVEAEALWGREIIDLVAQLNKCVIKLKVSLGQYLRMKRHPERYRNMRPEKHDELDDIVFLVDTDPEKDQFAQEVARAIRELADYLRQKLAG